ncbi:MAG: LysM peptidoglycan-binding domain-containing protein [Phaeodactylibacter sp.]|nr:LysM peptidoglycan-binding domain-containing protein [Phaeodactylibacter sp.]
MVNPLGQLSKMSIAAFSGPKMLPNEQIGRMEALINPENYTQEFKIEYNEEQGEGTSANAQNYQKTANEKMDFRFLFDRTGAFPDSLPKPDGVMGDINNFKDLTYKFLGEIHRPPYLILTWGTLVFPCVLESLSIEYKLFKSDGTPIRAEIKAGFNKFVDEELRANEEDKQSPDLTKVHTVKDGETLHWLAYKVYGDSKYYIDIARVNQLVNFQTLQEGQQIVFPPLEK